MIKYRAPITMALYEVHERPDVNALRAVPDAGTDGYRYVIWNKVMQVYL